MASEESIELEVYHEAIKTALGEAFPGFDVNDYERKTRKLANSSLMLELTGWTPPDEGQDSTGMLSWDFSWSVYLAIKYNSDHPKLSIRKHALALSQTIEQARWGLPLAQAHVLTAEPDDFDPELDAYEVWRVDFTQAGRVGVNAFAEGAEASEYASTEPYASMEPETGIPNEPAYTPLE